MMETKNDFDEIVFIREEILVENDGIVKKIIKEGENDLLPKEGQEILAHYEGRLTDGTVFDSSYKRNEPFKFMLGLDRVIKAWDISFATMKKGEEAVIFGKPKFCYGETGSPPAIPPNSCLQFKVKLIDFYDKKKEKWEMNKDEKYQASLEEKEKAIISFKENNFKSSFDTFYNSYLYVENEDTQDELKLSLLNNLSIASGKLDNWKESYEFAEKALQINSNNEKSLYRSALAENKLSEWDKANDTLNKLLLIDSNNKPAINLKKLNTKAKNDFKIKEQKIFKKLYS